MRSTSAIVALIGIVLLAATACADPISGAPAASVMPGTSMPAPSPDPASEPLASGELAVDPCQSIYATQARLDALRAVELRLPNRDELDIELGNVLITLDELRTADFGELQPQLEAPLTRLGHESVELELAVEDFRTNPRPRQAASHVEEDAQDFADALAALALLARC